MRRIGFATTHEVAGRLSSLMEAQQIILDAIVVHGPGGFSEIPLADLPEISAGDEVAVCHIDDLGTALEEVALTFDRARRMGISIFVAELNLRTSDNDGRNFVRGLREASQFQARVDKLAWQKDIAAARSGGAFGSGRPRKLKSVTVADLRAQGISAAEIARQLNVSRWTVYRKLKQLDLDGAG